MIKKIYFNLFSKYLIGYKVYIFIFLIPLTKYVKIVVYLQSYTLYLDIELLKIKQTSYD